MMDFPTTFASFRLLESGQGDGDLGIGGDIDECLIFFLEGKA